ncbi:hypothetical protein HK102_002651 [Quaeritorhiza haematococci]|nr:hypothetical protein HK102_002651 [Quaeritorhiza haematococci]
MRVCRTTPYEYEITSSKAAISEEKAGARVKPLALCRETDVKTFEIQAGETYLVFKGMDNKPDISVFTKDRRLYLTLHHTTNVTTSTRPLLGKKMTIPEYEIDLPAKSVLSERLPKMDLDLILADCLAVVRLGGLGGGNVKGKGDKWVGWDTPKPEYTRDDKRKLCVVADK